MNQKDDRLAAALRGLPSPALDPVKSERVRLRARAHLASAAPVRTRLRLTLAGALVPGLLGAAVVDHLAETVTAVDEVYGANRGIKKGG